MKKTTLIILSYLSLIGFSACGNLKSKTEENKSQKNNLNWLQKWFAAWELVSTDVLALPPGSIPEMVFFDSSTVYTTSRTSAPGAVPVDGPTLFGKSLHWLSAPHHGKLTLPGGHTTPIELMSFAGPMKNGASFFVMAAPSFWKASGIESNIIPLDQLLTGVFIHEFVHTRQSAGFGAMIDSMQVHFHFGGIDLNDDVVQYYFKPDTAYTRLFHQEVDKFYEAAFSKNLQETKSLTQQGLDLLTARHNKYFKGDRAFLAAADDIFLSMEGLGQFAAVSWLTHPKGGNIPFEKAVDGFRRKRNKWSQEEGLALCLLADKLIGPQWKQRQFGKNPTPITTLLKEYTGGKINSSYKK